MISNQVTRLKKSDSRITKISPLIGPVFGFWIGGVYAAVIGGRILGKTQQEEGTAQVIYLVLAITWPLVYFTFSRNRFVPNNVRRTVVIAIVVFLAFSLLSCFMSPVGIHSLAFVGLTLISIWIALQFISSMNEKAFEIGLKVYSLTIIVILLGFAFYDYVPGLRLGMGKGLLNPNAIGVVCISAVISSMAVRNVIMRCLLIGTVSVIIYLTGSRSAAVCSLLGLAITSYERTRLSNRFTKAIMVLSLSGGLIVMYLYWNKLAPAFEDFMQVHSQQRGLSSGASGRTIVWGHTWKLFLDSPMFGIGFRAHESILGVSAHNGYLAMLSEIGIFGFISVIYLIFSGVLGLWRRTRNADSVFSYSILFGLCCAYLVLALFERFLINVGNPTSLLFLIGILLPSVRSRIHPVSFRGHLHGRAVLRQRLL